MTGSAFRQLYVVWWLSSPIFFSFFSIESIAFARDRRRADDGKRLQAAVRCMVTLFSHLLFIFLSRIDRDRTGSEAGG